VVNNQEQAIINLAHRVQLHLEKQRATSPRPLLENQYQSPGMDTPPPAKGIITRIMPADPARQKARERQKAVQKILGGLRSEAGALPKSSQEAREIRYFIKSRGAQGPYANLSPEQFSEQLAKLEKKREWARGLDEYKPDVPAWLAYLIVFSLIFLILKLL
jgi:hypothetical protein